MKKCRFVPGMRQRRWGRVIQLATIGAYRPNKRMPHYYAAKGALANLTASLAKELAGTNITVNTVSPGMTDTDIHADLSPEQVQALATNVPLRRLGTSEDTAQAILFLASDAGSYVTGTVLDVNGGLHMG